MPKTTHKSVCHVSILSKGGLLGPLWVLYFDHTDAKLMSYASFTL